MYPDFFEGDCFQQRFGFNSDTPNGSRAKPWGVGGQGAKPAAALRIKYFQITYFYLTYTLYNMNIMNVSMGL